MCTVISCYMPIIHLEFKFAHIGSFAAAPTAIHRKTRRRIAEADCGLDRGATVAAKAGSSPGPMAEWLRRGLQILARRFDSGSGLHLTLICLSASLKMASGGSASLCHGYSYLRAWIGLARATLTA